MQIFKTGLLIACAVGIAVAVPTKRAGAKCGLQYQVSGDGTTFTRVGSQVPGQKCAEGSICCVGSKSASYQQLINNGRAVGTCQSLEAEEKNLSCFQ